MPRFRPVLFALAVVAANVVGAAERPVHIFVLSGQSNMAGMNPELGLVPEAAAQFPDGGIAYLKVARGGQPIRYWVAAWDDIVVQGHDILVGTSISPEVYDEASALREEYRRANE